MGLDAKNAIETGRTALGIEFGSTRIKAVLIDEEHEVLAIGNHDWENQLVNNIWTYSLDAIWKGLQDCYQDLAKSVQEKYGTQIRTLGSLGFSAMMHGSFWCLSGRGETRSRRRRVRSSRRSSTITSRRDGALRICIRRSSTVRSTLETLISSQLLPAISTGS